MSLERLFSIANLAAMLGWLVLIFGWRWRRSATLVAGLLIPALLAVVYTFLIASTFGKTEGGFGSLADVAKLFENRAALLAGWVHYLAFDLFIGAWEARDAKRLGIPLLAMVPVLFLTFMLGPIGLLLYFVLRAAWKRKIEVDDAPAAG